MQTPSSPVASRTTSERFSRFSRACALTLGSPLMFVVNCIFILLWLVSGPMFKYSDTWQLVVNTVTTVLTYLAVFLLQNTQNRDTKAIHLKLDELIRSNKGARNHLVDLEDLSDAELQKLEHQFKRLSENSSNRVNKLKQQRETSRKAEGSRRETRGHTAESDRYPEK